MNFQSKIEHSIFKKKGKSPLKSFHEIIFVLGKELGWSPRDICDCPLPLILGVLDELQEHSEREKKAYSKKK